MPPHKSKPEGGENSMKEAYRLIVRHPAFNAPVDSEFCSGCVHGAYKPDICHGYSETMPACNDYAPTPFWIGLCSILPEVADSMHKATRARLRAFLAQCMPNPQGLHFAPNDSVTGTSKRKREVSLYSVFGHISDMGTSSADVMARSARRVLKAEHTRAGLFARLDRELGI